MRVRPFTVIAVGAAVISLLVFVLIPRHDIPEQVGRDLAGAQQFELLSLDPQHNLPGPIDPKTELNGHTILGGTLVTDPATRNRLIDALRSGARESDGRRAACFDPRHAIRISRDRVVTEIVICFECSQVQVWSREKRIADFTISGSPEAVYDDVLRSANVPLAKKSARSATQ